MRHLDVLPLVLGLSAATLACGGVPHDSPDSVVFGAPILLTCSGSTTSSSIAVGDFDGDHTTDIAGCVSDSSVSVFLNKNGTLVGPVQTNMGGSWLQAHDVNGDGKVDLATYSSKAESTVVGFAAGGGTFQPTATDYPELCDNYTVSFDGYANAVCNNYTNKTVTVKDIASDGSTIDLFSMSVPAPARAADVDGDGKPDFVYPVGSSVAVQLGLGGSSFGPMQVVVTADDKVQDIDFADVDGDGVTDMIVKTGTSSTGYTYFVVQNKNGTLTPVSQFAAVESVDYAFRDVTGDGIMDVVLTDHAQLAIMVGKGDGTFEKTALLVTGPWTDASHFEFTDLNGDGKPDLVVGDGATISVLLRQ